MSIKIDPEKNESRALFELVDFAALRVLEIGCGDGHLTVALWGESSAGDRY